jgi:hypothetical protein
LFGWLFSHSLGSGKDLLGISVEEAHSNNTRQRKGSYSSQGRVDATYLPFKNKRERKEFNDYVDLVKEKYQLTHQGDALLSMSILIQFYFFSLLEFMFAYCRFWM